MNSVADRTATLSKISTRRTIQAALLSRSGCPFIHRIFDEQRQTRIGRFGQLHPRVLTPKNLAEESEVAARCEALFTCWGLPSDLLTPENFPSLRVLFHSGGTVKFFARPLLDRGITVICAREANAVAVAQFCLGQIILSCKGYFQNTQMSRNTEHRRTWKRYMGPGLYGEKVALLGMGAVARKLVPLLRMCDLSVMAVDPYLTPEEASQLGVELVSTEEAFATALVVSNHLPDMPTLRHVLDKRLFSSMRPYATFINTGRGAQVNEADLVEVARERSDLTALLDVTSPEPPLENSPLYELPNIHLTTHIAGAINDEVGRLGDFTVAEFERYAADLPLHNAVTPELFDRLA